MPKIIVIIAKTYCLLVTISKNPNSKAFFFSGCVVSQVLHPKAHEDRALPPPVREDETEDEQLIEPSVLEMNVVCVLNRNRCY